MRVVRNQSGETTRQLHTSVGSALETATSIYDLANLISTEVSRVRVGSFETRLRE